MVSIEISVVKKSMDDIHGDQPRPIEVLHAIFGGGRWATERDIGYSLCDQRFSPWAFIWYFDILVPGYEGSAEDGLYDSG